MGASHWMVDHVEPNGENRMKCVHGVEMAMSCGECFADFGDGRAGVRSGGIQSDQWVQLPSVDNQLKERMANELASLTQAIQELSGNVAKLVEERSVVFTPPHWSSKEIKRGPVTDKEWQEAATAYWLHYGCGTSPLVRALTHFAKSRGLID